MPIEGSSIELINTENPKKKKRSHKKRRHHRKLQSKGRNLDGNETNGQSINGNLSVLNKLTPVNIASLRWDNVLTDPVLENERIERYKELRRQRYTDARQHAIRILMEQMQVTPTIDTTIVAGHEQQ